MYQQLCTCLWFDNFLITYTSVTLSSGTGILSLPIFCNVFLKWLCFESQPSVFNFFTKRKKTKQTKETPEKPTKQTKKQTIKGSSLESSWLFLLQREKYKNLYTTLDILDLVSLIRKDMLLISFCTTKFCSSLLKFWKHTEDLS